MPPIKVERIVSFNSEDNVHVASNLLIKDTAKKWKCKSSGETSATVVLQLDQPHVITGVDIGNEHSAYIEVLVSRSTSPEDYKVLLVMSSFMTPLESRQSQNINKVRMFKQQDFSEPERDEKWDRIKIVCTQPFNRHVQYGLSFISLYSSDGKEESTKQHMGKFAIRAESPDNISAGSLFARIKKSQEDPLKGAAAIREASNAAQTGSPAVKQKMKYNFPSPNTANNSSTDSPKTRNRNELLYSKDEEDSNEKIDKLIQQKAKERSELEEEVTRKKELIKKQKEQKQAAHQSNKEDSKKKTDKITQQKAKEKADLEGAAGKKELSKKHQSHKRKSSDEILHTNRKKKKAVQRKPFSKLFENVVLVISGIQNPDRSSLRSMALSMGAKYKADWDNSCTHLVCAFANTPKFHQVKGKGKIITRKWIEDCYNEKKRLPWRRYALDKSDKGPDSEEEVWEENSSPPSDPDAMDEENDLEDDTKETGVDVDDVIRKLQNNKKTDQKHHVYDVRTDSEPEIEPHSEDLEITNKLENIFDHKIFYVDEVFGEKTEKKLKQYIVAYNGLITDNLENTIDIIVTNKTNSKIMKDLYPSAACITSDWIWECHNKQTLASMKGFTFE